MSTISLQLGIPISFSNLGTIIEDVFEVSVDETSNQIEDQLQRNLNLLVAFRKNAKQVMFSVKEYFRISKDTERNRLEKLEKMFLDTEEKYYYLNSTRVSLMKNAGWKMEQIDQDTISAIKDLQDHYRQFLQQVLLTCREIWAKFDKTAIYSGLLLMVLTLISCFVMLYSIYNSTEEESISKFQRLSFSEYIGLSLNIASWFILISQFESSTTLLFVITSFQMVSIGLLVLGFLPSRWKADYKESIGIFRNFNGITLILFFLYLGIFLSDSFTIQENSSLLSLLQILLLHKFLVYISKCFTIGNHNEKAQLKARQQKKDESFKVNTNYCLKAIVILTASCCIRLSAVFWNCREEHQPCIPSMFLRQSQSLIYKADAFMIRVRLFLAVSSILTVLLAVYYWCKKTGNLIASSSITLCIKLLLPVSGLCVLLHWTLWFPDKSKMSSIFNLPWLQQVFFPRVAYGALLLAVLSLLWDPLGIYVLLRNQKVSWRERISVASSADEYIQAVFKDLRDSMSQKRPQRNPEENLPPLVYGLGTVYSTAFFVLMAAFALLLMMLLNDGLAFSVVLMIISALCLIADECLANMGIKKRTNISTRKPTALQLYLFHLLFQ